MGAVGTGRGGWIPVSVQAKLIQTGKWMCHVGNGAKTGESAHKARRQKSWPRLAEGLNLLNPVDNRKRL